MNEYKIGPDGMRRLRLRLLKRMVPLMAISLVAVFFIVTFQTKNTPGADNTLVNVIIFPFLALYFSWIVYKTIRRQTRLLSSYTVMLTDNLISREQDKTPTIAIYRKEIRAIHLNRNGGLNVKGPDAASLIIIHPEIDNLDELRASLEQTMPITAPKASRIALTYLAVVATVGSYAGAILFKDNILSTLCALVCIGVMIWGFIQVRTNRNIDERAKRASWFMFIVIFSMVSLIYYHWTHQPLFFPTGH